MNRIRHCRPWCIATGIGSLPYAGVDEALDLVCENVPRIPFWPQLPRRGFGENMYAQYAAGFPGLVIDRAAERLYVDPEAPDFIAALGSHCEAVDGGDLDRFAIDAGNAAALRPALARFAARRAEMDLCLVKGQITGPISFGLMVTTADRRSIIYHDTLAELLVGHLGMNARWQERMMAESLPGVPRLMFVDEPYMASFGTAFCAVSREMVTELLAGVFAMVDGYTGVHCCGNTDWSLLLDSGVDVVNFDAWEYGENLLLYLDELREFLGRGGCLAWGIVPTSEVVAGATTAGLLERFTLLLDRLTAAGIAAELALSQSIITPSCGCGSLTIPLTERVFRLTRELAVEIRRRYDLPEPEIRVPEISPAP
ncbi:MAG: hypothetical protein JW781_11160 [Deltaproteobacteria bacterium]|nr:hypothetical protein [Candidatus Anaeroferrophillacea bacterium]